MSNQLTDLRWLFVRFGAGAGGKMLLALLQASPQMAKWNITGQDHETWFKKCYPGIFEEWLHYEPKDPYDLKHVVSGRYPRGEDLTHNEFFVGMQQKCNPKLWQDAANDLILGVIWTKKNIPSFFTNRKIVDIVVDEDSKDIFLRLHLKKRFVFQQKENSLQVIFQEHRPYYQIPGFYNDHIQSFNSYDDFFSKHIQPLEKEMDMTCQETKVIVRFSDLISKNFVKSKFDSILQELDLAVPDMDLVERCHHHWLLASGL